MKVEKDINTFGGKLYRLFLEKGYDLESQNSHALRRLEKDMLEKGLITSDYDLRSQLSKDVKLSVPYPDISTSTLRMYCEFLNCSADYLLGFIDYPTHSITDINKATGLTSDAIKNLITIKTDNYSDLFNYLLSEEGGFYLVGLLRNFSLYIWGKNSDLAVFDFEKNKTISIPKKSVFFIQNKNLSAPIAREKEIELGAILGIQDILIKIRDNLSC